jgi:hypothetical protein
MFRSIATTSSTAATANVRPKSANIANMSTGSTASGSTSTSASGVSSSNRATIGSVLANDQSGTNDENQNHKSLHNNLRKTGKSRSYDLEGVDLYENEDEYDEDESSEDEDEEDEDDGEGGQDAEEVPYPISQVRLTFPDKT